MIAVGSNMVSPGGGVHVTAPPEPRRRCGTFSLPTYTACGCTVTQEWHDADPGAAVTCGDCLWVMRQVLKAQSTPPRVKGSTE